MLGAHGSPGVWPARSPSYPWGMGFAHYVQQVDPCVSRQSFVILQVQHQGPDSRSAGHSNAAAYANSVLGARTQKYPDHLDVMIAITGWAPNANCNTGSGRPLLGYFVGQRVGAEFPFILGLNNITPVLSIREPKPFGAAVAMTPTTPMFQIEGVTPEAQTRPSDPELKRVRITLCALRACLEKLNTHVDNSVALTSPGNPHFASDEFAGLVKLTRGRTNITIDSDDNHDESGGV
ncbi:uncharacterized protein APUU_10120A [Aspergillus puulaauensis]|uniref:Phosphomevalonate dehydratase large subunit-like domain-containing protein n=1 Tax=Aspergillus puulaauensis TaxID=1220207 RepID=A0A7R8AGF2_9EURO|nr:uncharacterized protein APUU_10120A [Aspergillus puulaauensis]BCS17292.1 hypothetical protein APUU_10120A [Aspergillus puulaauensis]